ncbi:hypothetical protein [Paenibacillus periandrae]|uniref:hypothetical protein n=1 Tax=Paenibacillus periandrae TaxID=1761741 RepID=UPI001F093AB3|nr:hypothetical protein [Paenibacillus periandrae]
MKMEREDYLIVFKGVGELDFTQLNVSDNAKRLLYFIGTFVKPQDMSGKVYSFTVADLADNGYENLDTIRERLKELHTSLP